MSSDAPACNVHGVPYIHLLKAERAASTCLLLNYRAALLAWLEADNEKPNSLVRRRKLARARILTEKAIN
ncbi:MAG TPA: hypothetical protein VN688_12435 [Gemmataceae bacterium]|nr:hypothetical protein [Gemmataceae bacterium]